MSIYPKHGKNRGKGGNKTKGEERPAAFAAGLSRSSPAAPPYYVPLSGSGVPPSYRSLSYSSGRNSVIVPRYRLGKNVF